MSLPPRSTGILKWAGSKRKLLPILLDYFPDHYERYVEPFAGSACVYFAARPKYALLCDINEDLIATYIQLQKGVEGVIEALAGLLIGQEHYYRIRALDSSELSKPDQAARFIYLNRFCFNGLYRTNRNGQFNVPYGGQNSGNLPSPDVLRECSTALKNATLRAASFEDTLETVQSGDFVYIDPPYSIASRRIFNSYWHASFGSEELQSLRKWLCKMDRLGIPFLVSYGQSREAAILARGFRSRQVAVQRQIAGFASDRRQSRELLITNN
jgi:DNA adenine methylase